jgi:hypothetical protein
MRDFRISLSPSLRFFELGEASLGELAVVATHKTLIPAVDALGLQEEEFGWTLTRTSEHPIRGTRSFYALIKCEKDAKAVEATLDLAADVRTRRRLLPPLRTPETARRPTLIHT